MKIFLRRSLPVIVLIMQVFSSYAQFGTTPSLQEGQMALSDGYAWRVEAGAWKQMGDLPLQNVSMSPVTGQIFGIGSDGQTYMWQNNTWVLQIQPEQQQPVYQQPVYKQPTYSVTPTPTTGIVSPTIRYPVVPQRYQQRAIPVPMPRR